MRPPDTYLVVEGRNGETMRVGRTLASALDGLGSPDSMWGYRIWAVFGSEMRQVPKEAYAEPDPPTREDALEFIRSRAADIAAYGEGGLMAARGLWRCSYTDPEEKQVAEYISTAMWKLRAVPDENWWRVLGGSEPDAP